jgi:uncharacterized protein (TIRG00374 family)
MADACEVPIEAPKTKLTWKTAVFPIIGLAAFFLYIYLFQVDLQEIYATLQTADPLPYVVAAVLSVIEILFFALSWRVLLNFLKIKLSIAKAYLFVWYGIFLDIIIPAESVSGEAARIYLLQREQGTKSCGPTVASLVTHRLLGMAMNIVILFVGMGLLFVEGQASGWVLNLIIFLAAGITLILVLLIVFSFKEQWSLKVVNGFVRVAEFVTRGHWKGLAKIKEDVFRITRSFHDSMKEFGRNPRPLALSLLGLTVTWVLALSEAYLVFLALRVAVSWSVILITAAIVLAVKSIPIGVPFEVGLPEITMTTLYTYLLEPTLGFGVAAGIAATATILNRVLTLWLRFIIGLGAQQWLDIKSTLTVRTDDTATPQTPQPLPTTGPT